jgi:hypothetical protein
MDAEALDAVAGGWGWSSVKRAAKKGYKSVKKNVINCYALTSDILTSSRAIFAP